MPFWQIVTSWLVSAYSLFGQFLRAFWWLYLAVFVIGLSLPPAIRNKSLLSFFVALPKVIMGVLLPLPIFWLSGFLTPDCKATCRFGWVDCFYMAKMTLMPIVFWSTAALYANDVLKAKRRVWIMLGIFMGAVTSTVLLTYGVIVTGLASRSSPTGEMKWWLLVPLYVAVWYSVRAIQHARSGGLRPAIYLYSLLASIPFWIAGIVWSMKLYQKLPEHSSCFVVTAASRGHEEVVGPFVVVQRGGRERRVNQQLLAFWQFEAMWDAHSPRSHRLFRRVYNIWGPHLARLVRNRWLADLAYILLKPLELLARLLTAQRQ